ncbi:hypothetical protein [Zoogloea sp.]|uniref:hypothetical protein n=1 Tax=Zoogloea sp. TaxID=49181 RepID=UPI0035AF3179
MHETIFTRAKRGDLPQALSIAEICRLSSANLQAPHGRYAADEALAVALRRLVDLGLVAPERSETVTNAARTLASFGGHAITISGGQHLEHYIRAADLRPYFEDLGEVGPLIAEWIMQGVSAPKSEGTGEAWHVERVRRFCEALVSSGEIDPDDPGFTAQGLATAMGQVGLWHRPGEPLPAPDTLRGYSAKTGGKFFVFPGGRPAGGQAAELRQGQAVRRLVEIFRRQTGQNSEPGNQADTVSASNFPRKAAG